MFESRLSACELRSARCGLLAASTAISSGMTLESQKCPSRDANYLFLIAACRHRILTSHRGVQAGEAHEQELPAHPAASDLRASFIITMVAHALSHVKAGVLGLRLRLRDRALQDRAKGDVLPCLERIEKKESDTVLIIRSSRLTVYYLRVRICAWDCRPGKWRGSEYTHTPFPRFSRRECSGLDSLSPAFHMCGARFPEAYSH